MCFKRLSEMTPLPRITTKIEPEAGEKLHHAASLDKLFLLRRNPPVGGSLFERLPNIFFGFILVWLNLA
jgi:hypothetical protein